MFRQDRTNPSTAVSTWKARKDLPRANPSTAISAWMNGGLAGGSVFNAYGGLITQYEDSGTTYRVHAFRSAGKFTITDGSADVDLLIVAGGGGGGRAAGGAGGVRSFTSANQITVEAASSPYTITVGTGGLNGYWSSVPQAADGTSTSALGMSATGGGKGGMYTGSSYNQGGNGGSGGGSYYSGSGGSGNAGSYSPVEGYDGGSSSSQAGGGADSSPTGDNGGSGRVVFGIGSGTQVVGGGGSGNGSGGGGGSVTGGGGPYVTDSMGRGGVPNTGGGSGGRAGASSAERHSGGAGLVLIRYVVA